MTYRRVCNKNNTTGARCGAGIAYPSREHEFTPGFCLGSCCSIFIVWALFCMSFFYPFSIFKHVLALTINTLFRKCKFCWNIYLINLVSFQALTTVQMILEFRATLQLWIVEVELLTRRGHLHSQPSCFGVVLCRQLFIHVSFSIDQCLVWPSNYCMYVQWTMNYVNKISGP